MENTQTVTQLPLPAEITISQGQTPTPNEMRRLKEAAGMPLTDIFSDGADPADQMQAGIWLELTRRGYQPTWEQAGDIRAVQRGAGTVGPYADRYLAHLAGFCHFWRLTPRDVDAMTPDEYRAFDRYMTAFLAAQKRANERARKGR